MTAMENRRAAVRAQLAALTEDELRLFVDTLVIDVAAIEVPLAEFLAIRAQVREQAAARVPLESEGLRQAAAYLDGAGDPGQ